MPEKNKEAGDLGAGAEYGKLLSPAWLGKVHSLRDSGGQWSVWYHTHTVYMISEWQFFLTIPNFNSLCW